LSSVVSVHHQGRGRRCDVTPSQRNWTIRIGLFVIIAIIVIIATSH
jgi:hypothetical protein